MSPVPPSPTPTNLPIDDPAVQSMETLVPPRTFLGILRQLGPGLILAAAIVGSGELIATTRTGAEAGISLLWLIIVGCIVKVFVQIEIGRAAIVTGRPTLSALNTLPGPRYPRRGNWIVWYWFIMWFCSISQLGGIMGGCGQALALIAPLTSSGRTANEINSQAIEAQVDRALRSRSESMNILTPNDSKPNAPVPKTEAPRSHDALYWSIPIAFATSFLLLVGRYSVIQTVSTILVATFTAVTLWNVIALQQQPLWQITPAELWSGLTFQLPQTEAPMRAVVIALSTVGIIGVGSAELIQYPYWCIEKGYARWTGPNDGSQQWCDRAKGWLRVMQFDAWTSMVIYTFATIAFFFLGVAILHRSQLIPADSQLLQTLLTMYTPVFGAYAKPIFSIGAIVVLYSTFFVANASHARTFADGLTVIGLLPDDDRVRSMWSHRLSGLFPILCLIIYAIIPKPALLVLISGVSQTLMLPMLGYAAIVFRYRDTPADLRPTKAWDVLLWSSVLVMFLLAVWQCTSAFIHLRS